MRILDLSFFKNILEREKNRIESQLKRFARRIKGSDDWEPKPADISNIQVSEGGEVADHFNKMATDLEIGKRLESELSHVNDAIKKVEDGNYGICEEDGNEINEDRLKANPTAKTCVSHSVKIK